MNLVPFIVPVLFFAPVLISLPLMGRYFRRNAERMRAVADELGFTYHGPGAEPPGTRETTSAAQWFLNALKPWCIGKETAPARFGKAVFGLRDIEVGVEQFDRAVRNKGNDPERIRRILSGTGIQDRILTALGAWPTVTVTKKAAHAFDEA